jgi:hypothetical protein
MNFLSKKHYKKIKGRTLLLLISTPFIFGVVFFVASADFTSTSFQLENPINILQGGEATSSSFQYFSTTGQLTNGQSASTNFAENAGFLYFPTASSPVVSATPGNAQVVLSWTSALPNFANITSYELGVGTVSNGPYVYTSVGNVLTTTKGSLVNGTPYFFRIRSYAAGNLLSESAEVGATPVAPSGGGGGGGGGGGAYVPPVSGASVAFSGKAYPGSVITILKDAQIIQTASSDSEANFRTTVNNLSVGNHMFSVYGEDSKGVRSSLLTFPVSITSNVVTNISGIFIAPTISLDKSEVKLGDTISIFGQTVPDSEVLINVNSEPEFFFKVRTMSSGVYFHQMDTTSLAIGLHSARSKAIAPDSVISSYSKSVAFTVGDKNIVLKKPTKCPAKGDLNNDCKVNLIDFSIAAFWYKKTLNTLTISLEQEKLNGDGKINLVDFSIMAYYWTG